MKLLHVATDLLLAHCGGSYAAALVAVPALIWFGQRDASVLLAAIAAPLWFPVMALQAFTGDFGRQFLFQGIALLLPAYVVGFLFALRFRFRRRVRRAWRDRIAAGLCGACGYDLTGNTSGVCPECGAARSQSDSKRAACL